MNFGVSSLVPHVDFGVSMFFGGPYADFGVRIWILGSSCAFRGSRGGFWGSPGGFWGPRVIFEVSRLVLSSPC